MLSPALLRTSVGLLLLSSAACGSDLPPLSIGLEFRLDQPGVCPSDSCADYGLDCGAVVSVRIFPGDSSPLDENEPLAESCTQVAADTNLCAIATMPLAVQELPAQRVRIEVALWSPETAPDGCPSGPMFDLLGLPLSTFDPQPAFAGARIVDAGDASLEVAAIPISCFDDDPLGLCQGGNTDVTAVIDDLDTLVFAPPLAAANLQVSVGVPMAELGPGDDTVFAIDAADAFDLELTRTLPVPQFEATVPRSFDDLVCVQVLDVAPQSTTAVTCSPVERGAMELDLGGFLVGKARVDQVLSVLGAGSFPPRGLVIGRAVDALGQASPGVTVSAMPPGGGSTEVLYVNETFDAVSPTGPTASHGYFVSTTAPFGTRWTAAHGDGRTESTAPVTGLIEGKVTALVIPLGG